MDYDKNQIALIKFFRDKEKFYWDMYPQWYLGAQPMRGSSKITGPVLSLELSTKLDRLYAFTTSHDNEERFGSLSINRAQAVICVFLGLKMFQEEYDPFLYPGMQNFESYLPDSLEIFSDQQISDFIEDEFKTDGKLWALIFDSGCVDSIRLIKKEIPIEEVLKSNELSRGIKL